MDVEVEDQSIERMVVTDEPPSKGTVSKNQNNFEYLTKRYGSVIDMY